MREYLLVFLVAGAVTYLLTVIAREIAMRTGAFAAVRDRDVHAEPIPYLGGLAMLGGLWAAYVVATQLPFLSTGGERVFDPTLGVLVAGTVICLVGVLDDIFDIDALMKLGGQIVASGILVVFGVQYVFIPQAAGGVLTIDNTQGALLTVLMVVATVNAVNFVDGLDGLAAGVVAIGAVSFFLFCYQLANVNQQSLAVTGALLCAGLAGVCAGFLVHNFHPARLFMGDSGSMLIGLVLSGAAITLTGQFPAADLAQGAQDNRASLLPIVLPFVLPLALLLVPLVDLVTAVIRRTRADRSPFAPDKQHLHHRLLEIGHSHRRAVLIMWLWAGTFAFGSVYAALYAGPLMWTVLAGLLVLSVALTFLLPRLRGIDGAVEPPVVEASEGGAEHPR